VYYITGGVKGLTGLMSEYAHDSNSEESDEDVDTSVYNLEAGLFFSHSKTGGSL